MEMGDLHTGMESMAGEACQVNGIYKAKGRREGSIFWDHWIGRCG